MAIARESDESGESREYGAAADAYRRIARAYNLSRLQHPQEGDTSLVAITLSASHGVPIPERWDLYGYANAREWWYGHKPPGIFYAALFDNNWYPRYAPKLLREYLKGAKWVGPMPYSPI